MDKKTIKILAGIGVGVVALAGAYLGLSPDNLSEKEIKIAEAHAQEIFGKNDAETVKRMVFNKMKPATVKIKGKDFELTGMNFKTLLKEKADAGWEYTENGKTLGLSSEGMAWDGKKSKLKANSVTGKIAKGKVKYDDALGAGIDIKIVQDNDRFQKIIEIESLESLGEIPDGAEYLEFSFKVSGDFVFPEGVIEERIPFGENSFLQLVHAWDSHVVMEEEDPNLMSGAFGEISGNVITKKIPVSWLRSAEYPVKTDLTVTYGSASAFNSSQVGYVSVDALDDSTVVIAYRDYGDGGNGSAVIGVISGGDTLTFGSVYDFNTSGGTAFTNVVALTSSSFFVAYKDDGNSGKGTAIVGTVASGDEISYGSESVYYNADSGTDMEATFVDSTHVALFYLGSGATYIGYSKIAAISGSTISFGGQATVNSANTNNPDIGSLDATHVAACYKDNGGDSYGHCKIGTISSGTSVSYGSEYTFNAGNTVSIEVVGLSGTKFVVYYYDVTTGDLKAKVGTVTGSAISYGDVQTVKSPNPQNSVTGISETENLLVYYSGTVAYAVYITVSGSDLSFDESETSFISAAISNMDLSMVVDTKFIVAYKLTSDTYGYGIIGEYEEPVSESNSTIFFSTNQ